MGAVQYEPEKFEIRIFDQKNDECYVELETLTHVLQGVQRAIFILAKDRLSDVQDKTLSANDKKSFSIRCAAPKPGSYVMPIEFGRTEAALCENQELNNIGDVAEKFVSLLEAFDTGDVDDFKRIVSKDNFKPMLAACRNVFPKAGAKWAVGFSGRRIREELKYYPHTTNHKIKKIQERVLPQDESSLCTVSGHLVEMNFEKRCITLKYPPTSTELGCYYSDEIEVELFENRRELLQITGNVTYGSDGETPIRIADVENIEFLDLSEFIIESFLVGDKRIEFLEPLVLTPSLTESCQFVTLRDERLGIDVMAQTREELDDELHAELSMLWSQSQMPARKLCKEFQTQKKHLLAMMKEETNDNA